MAHRNRWFTELKNGWIFPWRTVKLPEYIGHCKLLRRLSSSANSEPRTSEAKMLQQATDDVEEDILQAPPGEVTDWHWPPIVLIYAKAHSTIRYSTEKKVSSQFLLRKLSNPLGFVYLGLRIVYSSLSLSLSLLLDHTSRVQRYRINQLTR